MLNEMLTNSKDEYSKAKKKWYSYGVRASEGQKFLQERLGIVSGRENRE